MGLSNDLLSQFAKMAKPEQETSKETTVQGVAKVEHDGVIFVQLDGSDRWTPVLTTVDVKDGEKVNVMIKDHTATITGNISSPSARTDDVKENSAKLSEFDTIVANKVDTKQLAAQVARIDSLAAKDVEISGTLTAGMAEIEKLHGKDAEISGKLTADEADISTLKTDVADIKVLQSDFAKIKDLEATNLKVNNLDATYGEFEVLTTNKFEATDASIKNLETNKLNADFANIDFANIDKAAIDELYVTSSFIEDLTGADGTFTRNLVGVNISGDMITAGTLKTDRLIVLGNDGNYYQLNTNFDGLESVEPVDTDKLHGSILVAESVTADKIKVTDLTAFEARIADFRLRPKDDEKPGAIFSDVKYSVDNETKGVYMDTEGQFSIGDGHSYIRYYKVINKDTDEVVVDNDGNPIFKLEIIADNILFGKNGRTGEDVANLLERVKIGTYTDQDTGDEKPSLELDEEDSDDKSLLTNDRLVFIETDDDGKEIEYTKVHKDSITTDTLTVNKEFRQGSLAWGFRTNGNYGLMWKGANS